MKSLPLILFTLISFAFFFLIKKDWNEYIILKKGALCSSYLLQIEEAKEKYKKENPLSRDRIEFHRDLLKYLPNTAMPVCPWNCKWEKYLLLNEKTQCPANGQKDKEPPIEPLSNNGFNDLGNTPPIPSFYEYIFQKLWDKFLE